MGNGALHCYECNLSGRSRCKSCNGKGIVTQIPGHLKIRKECKVCLGRGNVQCNKCCGLGKINCSECDGSGSIYEEN